MSNNMEPMHQNDLTALRMEYEEEKRVFDWMKKCFFVLAPTFVVVLIVMGAANIPTFTDRYGSDGIMSLIAYTPLIVMSMIPAALWAGCIPSGYIWAVRAIRRSRMFVLGNFIFLAFILVFLITIPALIAPIVFLAQWGKVSHLKKSLNG